MKIVVIGGTGLIGSRLVTRLQALGHEALAAAPTRGINIITGEGLADALRGARAVVDVANSPSLLDDSAMDFFTTGGRNLLAAELEAGVRHHLALSVVGTEHLLESGYFRAKLAQEELIKASSMPYTLLRSTQAYPFVSGIVEAAGKSGDIRLSPALVQPVDPDDLAGVLALLALAAPANGMLEVAGPEVFRLDRFAEAYLSATEDPREVFTDPRAPFFGAILAERVLVPRAKPCLGTQTFEGWLRSFISAD